MPIPVDTGNALSRKDTIPICSSIRSGYISLQSSAVKETNVSLSSNKDDVWSPHDKKEVKKSKSSTSTREFDKTSNSVKSDRLLQYYIVPHPEPSSEIVLRLCVRVGSLVEEDHQRGIAHILEHMGFCRTASYNRGELIKTFEKMGSSFGADLNAHTSLAETVYKLQVDTKDARNVSGDIHTENENASTSPIETSIRVLAEWAFAMSILQSDLDEERLVVEEEWRASRGVRSRMLETFWQKTFADTRYAKRIPIGLLDVIQNCTADDVRQFYEKWYIPENMAIVITGDMDQAGLSVHNVVAMLQKEFQRTWAWRNNHREQRGLPSLSKVPPAIPPTFRYPCHTSPLLCQVLQDDELSRPSVALEFYEPLDIQPTLTFMRQEIHRRLLASIVDQRFSMLTKRMILSPQSSSSKRDSKTTKHSPQIGVRSKAAISTADGSSVPSGVVPSSASGERNSSSTQPSFRTAGLSMSPVVPGLLRTTLTVLPRDKVIPTSNDKSNIKREALFEQELDSTQRALTDALLEMERLSRFGVEPWELALARDKWLFHFRSKQRSNFDLVTSSSIASDCVQHFLSKQKSPLGGFKWETETCIRLLQDITVNEMNKFVKHFTANEQEIIKNENRKKEEFVGICLQIPSSYLREGSKGKGKEKFHWTTNEGLRSFVHSVLQSSTSKNLQSWNALFPSGLKISEYKNNVNTGKTSKSIVVSALDNENNTRQTDSSCSSSNQSGATSSEGLISCPSSKGDKKETTGCGGHVDHHHEEHQQVTCLPFVLRRRKEECSHHTNHHNGSSKPSFQVVRTTTESLDSPSESLESHSDSSGSHSEPLASHSDSSGSHCSNRHHHCSACSFLMKRFGVQDSHDEVPLAQTIVKKDLKLLNYAYYNNVVMNQKKDNVKKGKEEEDSKNNPEKSGSTTDSRLTHRILSNGINILTLSNKNEVDRIKFQAFQLRGTSELTPSESFCLGMLDRLISDTGIGTLDALSFPACRSLTKTRACLQKHFFHRGIGGSCGASHYLEFMLQQLHCVLNIEHLHCDTKPSSNKKSDKTEEEKGKATALQIHKEEEEEKAISFNDEEGERLHEDDVGEMLSPWEIVLERRLLSERGRILKKRMSVDYHFSQRLRTHLYGGGDPNKVPTLMKPLTMEVLDSINLEMVKQTFRKCFGHPKVAKQFFFVFVGDLPQDEAYLDNLFECYLGSIGCSENMKGKEQEKEQLDQPYEQLPRDVPYVFPKGITETIIHKQTIAEEEKEKEKEQPMRRKDDSTNDQKNDSDTKRSNSNPNPSSAAALASTDATSPRKTTVLIAFPVQGMDPCHEFRMKKEIHFVGELCKMKLLSVLRQDMGQIYNISCALGLNSMSKRALFQISFTCDDDNARGLVERTMKELKLLMKTSIANQKTGQVHGSGDVNDKVSFEEDKEAVKEKLPKSKGHVHENPDENRDVNTNLVSDCRNLSRMAEVRHRKNVCSNSYHIFWLLDAVKEIHYSKVQRNLQNNLARNSGGLSVVDGENRGNVLSLNSDDLLELEKRYNFRSTSAFLSLVDGVLMNDERRLETMRRIFGDFKNYTVVMWKEKEKKKRMIEEGETPKKDSNVTSNL